MENAKPNNTKQKKAKKKARLCSKHRSKQRFMLYFFAVTALLAVVRLVFPSVAADKVEAEEGDRTEMPSVTIGSEAAALVLTDSLPPASMPQALGKGELQTRYAAANGTLAKGRIYSVPGFDKSFPDQQDVQIAAAQKWGVRPVADSAQAAKRKKELVYVGSNPYFHVDRLRDSSPFLVPRASVLLQDIGRNFFDSLQVKRIPLHKIIVTSVLRTKANVATLQKKNGNATQNSCHLYGTTFDICYNRYKTVEPPGQHRREVRNDTLKWVLAEVLRDMRERERCYVKYEVRQGCWHITTR